MTALLKTLQPGLFGEWKGASVVTKGIETQEESKLPLSYAFVAGPRGFEARDRIETWENGRMVGEAVIPTAQKTRCPVAPVLRIEVFEQAPLLIFGRGLALIRTRAIAREGASLSSLLLFLRVLPGIGDDRFPLEVRLDFPDGRSGIGTQRFTLDAGARENETFGKGFHFPHKQIFVPVEFFISVRDAQGTPLLPASQKPFRRTKDAAILALEKVEP